MPNHEPHLIAVHVDALHLSPFSEALQLRGWIDFYPKSRPHLADKVPAIQPEAAGLFSYQFAKPRLQLLRQGNSSESENRYAEAVFKKDP